MFIVIEGMDGTGKSTQIELFHNYLQEQGHLVHKLREPGGNLVGEQLRGILKQYALTPIAELFCFLAARAECVSTVIRPKLAEGYIVLCDRFTPSTIAYQGYGRGHKLDTIVSLNNLALQGLAPDLTIILTLPTQVRQGRLASRGEPDIIEKEDVAFFSRVQDGYTAQLATSNTVEVNADGEPEEVLQRIVNAWSTHVTS